MTPYRDIVHFAGAAGSAAPPGARNMHPAIVRGGYAEFFRAKVQPALDLGCECVLVHNPHGTEPDGSMVFDQWLRKAPGVPLATSASFVEAFRPMRARGQRAIMYLGRVGKLNGMQVLLSVIPAIDAEMDVAVDSADEVAEGSVQHLALCECARKMARYGGRLVVESAGNTVRRRHWKWHDAIGYWGPGMEAKHLDQMGRPAGVQWMLLCGFGGDEAEGGPWMPARVDAIRGSGCAPVVDVVQLYGYR